MEIEKRNGEGNIAYDIRKIEGDMGESTRLDLTQQADGDIILTIYDIEKKGRLSIEFCSSRGGSRNPVIALKLRELVNALVEQKSH